MTSSRTILSIIGPHSGCGKTTFVIHLLRQIGGLGTLKISPAHDWPAPFPVGEDGTEQDFFLEDAAHLHRHGKDTALYAAAGAVQVERLRHRKNALARGLVAALDRYPPSVPVIVESSSAVKLLTPAVVVLVVRPPIKEMKPSTEEILPQVTDLLVNASDRNGLERSPVSRSGTPLDKGKTSLTSPLGKGGKRGIGRFTGKESSQATIMAERLKGEFPSLRPQYTWSTDLMSEPLPEKMLTRLRSLLMPDRR